MKDYIIVKDTTPAQIEKRVKWWMSEGYECLGGISIAISPTTGRTIYAQAMISKD